MDKFANTYKDLFFATFTSVVENIQILRCRVVIFNPAEYSVWTKFKNTFKDLFCVTYASFEKNCPNFRLKSSYRQSTGVLGLDQINEYL